MNQVAEHQVPATDTMTKVQPFVPLWGLAVAGAVIVALILTIASNSVFGLDFFHVFAGALWISTDFFMGFIIGPIVWRKTRNHSKNNKGIFPTFNKRNWVVGIPDTTIIHHALSMS